jgi:3-oxocholest-4-en-26-oyl-CoA dehydrogenase beta subunit
MDFAYSSDQQELAALAARILGDRCTQEHLRSIAATDSATDLDLWRAMAAAGLVGIGLPEAVGGAGLGFTEACLVLAEVARAAAPVPALAVMALGAPALARYGTHDELAGVADGAIIVTAALHEAAGDVYEPSAVFRDGRVTGSKVCVPAALLAEKFVVTTVEGLAVVDKDASGVHIVRADTTSGIPEGHVEFHNTPGRLIAGPEGVVWLLERAIAAQCTMMAAACDAAVKLTAQYAKDRVQFDRAIATFQAVGQRAADAYIDTEAIRLTAMQAVWLLDGDQPAGPQVASAKFWAAEGGQRVLLAAHHIHGGVGVDRDYPLHRYYLMGKQLELSLGSATPSLLRLGRQLANTPV